VNYHEFEIQTYEDLFNEENSFYTCIVVLLHALLKCTNNKFRDQLSERMDSDEQILLAKFLEATQFSLFTKQNILDALLLTNDINISSSNISSGKIIFCTFIFFKCHYHNYILNLQKYFQITLHL
jgi:hypothetical protein